jgi:hypothetical protein
MLRSTTLKGGNHERHENDRREKAMRDGSLLLKLIVRRALYCLFFASSFFVSFVSFVVTLLLSDLRVTVAMGDEIASFQIEMLATSNDCPAAFRASARFGSKASFNADFKLSINFAREEPWEFTPGIS